VELKRENIFFILVISLGVLTLYSIFSTHYYLLIASIPSFLFTLIISRYNFNKEVSVSVNQNIIEVNGSYYRSVLVVEDVRADYRDFTESSLKSKIASFYKTIGTAESVDLILRKTPVDKIKYLDSLTSQIQNLRIILENDPSNEKAKRKAEILNLILSKIEEGEIPFKYQMFILISGHDKASSIESAKVIKRGLEAIGIRCREATEKEVKSILSNFILPSGKEKSKLGTSFHLPFMTPFTIEKEPRSEFIESGIPLGRELTHNKMILWNPFSTSNRHAIVIGPTGSGKTEFLIWLGCMYNFSLGSSVLFFDIKGDIKKRLREYGIPFKVLNPLVYSVGSFQDWGVPEEVKLLQMESSISASFKLNRLESSILYKVLRDSLEKRYTSWEQIKRNLEEIVGEFRERNLLDRVLDVLSYVEPQSNPNGDIVSKLEYNGVNVIDLTLLKSDEIKRFIIYTIILRIYNKYSQSIIDDKNRIALIVDEAWTILKDESTDYPIIADLVKKGRGHGISIVMSSQNIEDLGDNLPIYVDNSGLLLALNNGDKEFWGQLKRFMDINDESLGNVLEYLGRGESVIRFLGDPRPLVVSLFNFKALIH